jgi:hypothetical protein
MPLAELERVTPSPFIQMATRLARVAAAPGHPPLLAEVPMASFLVHGRSFKAYVPATGAGAASASPPAPTPSVDHKLSI